MEVTGYTAERMKAIEDASVVNGEIDPVTGELILTRFDNSEINAGLAVDPDFPAFSVFPRSGLFKIAGFDLAATALTMDFTGIPATFDHLQLKAHLRSNVVGSSFDNLILQLNADVTDANYFYQSGQVANATWTGTQNIGAAQSRNGMLINGANSPANMFTNLTIDIPDYLLAHTKQLEIKSNLSLSLTSGNVFMRNMYYVWNSVAAINRLKLSLAGGGGTSQFLAGSRATLYGIKV